MVNLQTSDVTDFLCLEPQTTQTDAKIIYDSCCFNLLFLCILRISVVNLQTSDVTDFLCFEPQTTQTDAKIIYDSYCCNLMFLRISAYSVGNSSSPIQELEPGATPCRGGRCAARYPHGPPAAANKNT